MPAMQISSLKREICEHEAAVTIHNEERNNDAKQSCEESDIENGSSEKKMQLVMMNLSRNIRLSFQ